MRVGDIYQENNGNKYLIIIGFGRDGTRANFALYNTDGIIGDDICAISTIERWGTKVNWKIKY